MSDMRHMHALKILFYVQQSLSVIIRTVAFIQVFRDFSWVVVVCCLLPNFRMKMMRLMKKLCWDWVMMTAPTPTTCRHMTRGLYTVPLPVGSGSQNLNFTTAI